MRLTPLLVALALLVPALPGRADPKDGVSQTAHLGLDQFRKLLESKANAKLAAAEAVLKDPGASEAQRAEARKTVADMKKALVGLDETGQVHGLYLAVKDARKSVNELNDQFRLYGSTGEGTVLTTELLGEKLGRVAKDFETYSKGLDYVAKGYALASDLEALGKQGYGPEVMRTAGALATLAHALSAFGDKAPLIGSLLKGYGDVTQALLGSVHQLEAKIEHNIDQGHIGVGSHGVASAKNLAWNDQEIGGTGARVAGLRDVYRRLDPPEIFVFDPKAERTVVVEGRKVTRKGRWWKLDTPDPDAVRRRFLTLRRSGVEAPTAAQILRDYRKKVFVRLSLAEDGVAPGGTLTVTPRVIRVHDRKRAQNVAVQVFDPKGERVIEGFSEAALSWPAPTEPGRYRVAVRLDPAVAGVWEPAEKGDEAFYVVGQPTRTRLSIKPRTVGPDGTAELLVTVRDAQGLLVDVGRVDLRLEPTVGTVIPSAHGPKTLAEGQARSEISLVGAPAGQVTVIAEYTGWALAPDWRAPSADRKALTVQVEAPPATPPSAPPSVAGPPSAPASAPASAPGRRGGPVADLDMESLAGDAVVAGGGKPPATDKAPPPKTPPRRAGQGGIDIHDLITEDATRGGTGQRPPTQAPPSQRPPRKGQGLTLDDLTNDKARKSNERTPPPTGGFFETITDDNVGSQ